MSTPAPPPTSPPSGPVIPVGLATALGGIGTLALGVVALVTAVLNGDHTSETIAALAGAVVTLATTIIGRMNQAAAVYRANPNVQGILDAAEVVHAPLDTTTTGTSVPPQPVHQPPATMRGEQPPQPPPS